MLTFFDGEPLKADLLLRGSTAIEFTILKGNGYEKIENSNLPVKPKIRHTGWDYSSSNSVFEVHFKVYFY